MIEALTMPVILLALANGIRQWRAMREQQSQRDEVQQLLALLASGCTSGCSRTARHRAPSST